MTDLIIKMLESIRSLLELKAARRKKIFEEVTEPTWHSFSKVHEDYKLSLSRYRKMVLCESQTILGLIENIIRDSVFTMDLRSDLFSITNSALSNNSDSYSEFKDFERAINHYFWIFEEPMDVTPSPHYNTRRISLIMYLCCHGEDINRQKAASLIDKAVEDLQESYHYVAKAYFKLRASLLDL